MYNRYIPQPDGTYRRNQYPESPTPQQRSVQREEVRRQESQPSVPASEPPVHSCQNCVHNQAARQTVPPRPKRSTPPVSVGSFLKQLLPKDFDTEDLIIVLLLLLMAGDHQEDQNSALLTLMLYLFL